MRELETKDERSLLLYLETRAVDHSGRVDPRHMNTDDFAIADRWAEEAFITFDRIRYKEIERLKKSFNLNVTNMVTLSDDAWEIAHHLRKAKALRTLAKAYGFIST